MNRGHYQRGYLPHRDYPGSVQAITFRLADSLPSKVIETWKQELSERSGGGSDGEQDERQQELRRRIRDYEDQGYGSCVLARSEAARAIQELLIQGHQEYYRLLEWCIMPNHVHVLIKLMDIASLGEIVRRWKGASARAIHEIRGATGSIWQREYFDRAIKDEDHFHRAVDHIRSNPVAAGLCESPEAWRFSSAGASWDPDAAIKPAEAGAPSILQSAVLYGILDLGYVTESDLETVTGELLAGGVDLLQLRAKGRDPAAILEMGRRVAPLCRAASVPFIVNDHVEVAIELQADGLHIGQDDGSHDETRKRVGPNMILGRSTHSPEQARQALADGFDYIGFGPLFPTPTKKGRPGIGVGDVVRMQAEVGEQIPMFCIGGITRANLPAVLDQGAKRVVIVSDLLTAPDITVAVREAKAVI